MSDTSLPQHPSNTPPPHSDDPPTFLSDVVDLLRQLKLAPSGDGGSTPRGPAGPPGPEPWPAIPGYEILGELGSGGMGVVYKARQVGLNRVVALKMILAAKKAGTNELVRFLAEAEAVAAVRHPNVVEVYELGHCDGRPYFAMEFVPGGSLSEWLRPKDAPPRRHPPVEAAGLLAAVARGVHAAHEAGIVHRDLKPGNVLLQGDRRQETGDSSEGDKGRETGNRKSKTTGQGHRGAAGSDLSPASCLLSPKVSDFGLAKRIASDMTRTLAVMGTPAYMAPEQAGGKAKFVGPAADVYALGVILYECLTGGVPFTADEQWAVLRKVVEDAPEPPTRRAAGVPRDLELICLKCLEKEAHYRYPTAAALADDLEAFAEGRAVSVRPVGAAARVWRWGRRNPAQAGLAALVLALAVVVPPAVIWNQGRLAASNAEAGGARKAQAEAEKLAAARELFGLENAIRRRSVDRPTGWTWANRTDLAAAAPLAIADAAPLAELRSAVVAVALAADLRPVPAPAPAKRRTMSAAVTRPDGAAVAVGEYKARGVEKIGGFNLGGEGGTAKVQLLDPTTGAVLRELVYPVGFEVKTENSTGQDGTRGMAFSPDGTKLFVGTRGGKVYRFDLAPGSDGKAKGWDGFKSPVDHLAAGPDGAVYGMSNREPLVIRWDAGTEKEQARYASSNGVHGLAVEPRTGDVVVSDGPHLRRLTADLVPRAERVPSPDGNPRLISFECGGRLLVAACYDTVVVFDPATLKPTDRFLDPDLRRSSHQGSVSAVAGHPTGAFLATASADDDDRQVKVWEVASGRRVAAVTVPGTGPIGVAWSGDGKTLHATAPGQVLRFAFAPSDAEQFACFHPHVLEAAALSPDGSRVAAVGRTTLSDEHRAVLVGTPGGVAVATEVPGRTVPGRSGVAFDPRSGRVVVSAKADTLFGWVPGGAAVALGINRKPPGTPRFSPDGSALWVTVEATAWRWDGDGRATRGSWTSQFGGLISGLPSLDALAAGPTRAAAGARDGSVFVLGEKGAGVEKIAAFPHPGDPVSSVALSPDETVAAAGTQGGRVRLCRVADGTETSFAAHAGGTTAVSFRRDGTLLATGGKDRAVKVWRRTGDAVELVFAAADLPSPVMSVEFARADDRLLVLLTNEHAVRVWDVPQLRNHLSAHQLGW